MVALIDLKDVTALIITRGDLPERMVEREQQYARLGIELLIIESPDVLTRWTSASRFVHTPYVFFQDDDVALPDEQILAIISKARPDKIVSSMYQDWVVGMGYFDLALVGLGGIVAVGLWDSAVERWTAAYPDATEHLKWDADFIIGMLTPHEWWDFGGAEAILPEASNDNRLWRQDGQLARKLESINMARKLKTVTGALMVKDGEATVAAALDSVRPMIDSLTVFDTGSTDRTLDVIYAWCEAEGLVLNVIEGEFEDFATSRNRLLDEARKHGDYFLMFDADEVWVGNKTLPPLALDIHVVNYDGPVSYAHPRIISSTFPCYFEGRVHAALTWDEEASGTTLTDLFIEHHGDLTHGDAAERIRRDIALLTEDLEAGVDVKHTLFMRGKAYEGVAEWGAARADYEARLEFEDEGSEEQYYSAWRLGCILIEKFGEVDMGADMLYSAWMNRRGRIESIRALARYLNAVADATPIPETDMVFVHRDEYQRPSQQEG